jgi:hypothetical protein
MKYKITPFAILAVAGIGAGIYLFTSLTFATNLHHEGDVYLSIFGLIIFLFSTFILAADRLAVRQLQQHYYSIAFTELTLIAVFAVYILLHQ